MVHREIQQICELFYCKRSLRCKKPSGNAQFCSNLNRSECLPINLLISLNQVGLIGSFNGVFVDGPLEQFSVTNFCRFTIQTHGARPVFEVSRLSFDDNERLREKVEELLANGFLEHSDSNWSSPAKPRFINEKLELCVNYGRLNEISANYESYSIPTIPSVLNSISESNIFSKVGDLRIE